MFILSLSLLGLGSKSTSLSPGPTPDPKCKLNISSFRTLPNLLDCLICTRNSVPIVLLLWMMGAWDRLGLVDSYWGDGRGTGGVYYLIACIFYFYLCFCLLDMFCLFFKWVEHDSCCVSIFVYYLFSLSQVPLTRSYWGIEIVVSVVSGSDHCSVDFLEQGRVF